MPNAIEQGELTRNMWHAGLGYRLDLLDHPNE